MIEDENKLYLFVLFSIYLLYIKVLMIKMVWCWNVFICISKYYFEFIIMMRIEIDFLWG